MTYPPYHKILPHITADSWRTYAAKKKQSVRDAIPKEWLLPKEFLLNPTNDTEEEERPAVSVLHVPEKCGILTSKELEITELDDAHTLLKAIESKKYSSKEVAEAFCKRAAIAHQLTNCLTEIFFDRALKRAKELDEHLATTGKLVGPLHGLCVSLKDQFDIKGIELTMGYAAYLGRVSPENASIVILLEELGAVLYVRTNVPQSLMMPDTFNHVFGRTHHPGDLSRSPGGSSGGEGALIAMKGSIAGCGTDIGGSVRVPSAFCGLHTIKPSSRRIPYGKATNSGLGHESIISVIGPMARSLETVNYLVKVILDKNPADYDSGAMPFAYNDALFEEVSKHEKLVIGLAGDDGLVHLAKPMKRALDLTVQALKAAGHEVIDFPITPYNRADALAVEIWLADGNKEYSSILDPIGEPLLTSHNGGDSSLRNSFEINTLNREKVALQERFLADWLSTKDCTSTGRPIDALLVAPVQFPACKPGQNTYCGYTTMFNLMDVPGVVLPVTNVDAVEDDGVAAEEPYNEEDETLMKCFNAKESAGLPVGIQLVGRRWQEEALLAVSQRVEAAIKKSREAANA